MEKSWENKIVEFKNMKVSDLVDNPKNWRRHPAFQKKSLAGVIEEVGIVDAVIYNKNTGRLVDGHLRVELARANSEDTLPVIVVELTEEEEDLILATFDPISSLARTERKTIKEILSRLENVENKKVRGLLENISKKASTSFVKKKVESEESEYIDDVVNYYDVKEGDLFQIGEHRVMCADSTNHANISKLVDSNYCHIMFSDPPYGIEYSGWKQDENKVLNDEKNIYIEFLPGLEEFLVEDTALYIWTSELQSQYILDALYISEFEEKCRIIWVKNMFQAGGASQGQVHYKSKHEVCVYIQRKGKTPRWFGPANETTVWYSRRIGSNRLHPNQKPEDLATRAIMNSTQPGEIVLDLFLGSGSTLMAAENLDRICYGIELKPEYVAMLLDKLERQGMEVVRL